MLFFLQQRYPPQGWSIMPHQRLPCIPWPKMWPKNTQPLASEWMSWPQEPSPLSYSETWWVPTGKPVPQSTKKTSFKLGLFIRVFSSSEQLDQYGSLIIPMGRLGRPHEIGKLAEFLVSDNNMYMTGSVVKVDGGQSNDKKAGQVRAGECMRAVEREAARLKSMAINGHEATTLRWRSWIEKIIWNMKENVQKIMCWKQIHLIHKGSSVPDEFLLSCCANDEILWAPWQIGL